MFEEKLRIYLKNIEYNFGTYYWFIISNQSEQKDKRSGKTEALQQRPILTGYLDWMLVLKRKKIDCRISFYGAS